MCISYMHNCRFHFSKFDAGSSFYRMVMDLGVQDSQEAEVAMNVIDRLSALTDAQINAMDPDTKLQVFTSFA